MISSQSVQLCLWSDPPATALLHASSKHHRCLHWQLACCCVCGILNAVCVYAEPLGCVCIRDRQLPGELCSEWCCRSWILQGVKYYPPPPLFFFFFNMNENTLPGRVRRHQPCNRFWMTGSQQAVCRRTGLPCVCPTGFSVNELNNGMGFSPCAEYITLSSPSGSVA